MKLLQRSAFAIAMVLITPESMAHEAQNQVENMNADLQDEIIDFYQDLSQDIPELQDLALHLDAHGATNLVMHEAIDEYFAAGDGNRDNQQVNFYEVIYRIIARANYFFRITSGIIEQESIDADTIDNDTEDEMLRRGESFEHFVRAPRTIFNLFEILAPITWDLMDLARQLDLELAENEQAATPPTAAAAA